MEALKKIKPAFWDTADSDPSRHHEPLNFQMKWKLIVVFTSLMALLPLLMVTLVEYRLTRQIVEDEMKRTMMGILQPAAASVASVYQGQTLDSGRLENILRPYRTGSIEDVFFIDSSGGLQTSSFVYGNNSQPAIPLKDLGTKDLGIVEDTTPDQKRLFVGYATIPGSNLKLVMIKSRDNFNKMWLKPRLKLLGYLVVSIFLILVSIMGMATYLVNRIHTADKKRVRALHHSGHANKLASIGRLAAGVAHEINNPLAIINEKTGLMVDLMSMDKDNLSNKRLVALAQDTLKAVERCGTVTQRLLEYTKPMDKRTEPVDIQQAINQTLTFFQSQARELNITISFEIKGKSFLFECNKGGIQQIILNLFNNAFAAMDDNGGLLKIILWFHKEKEITISVSDTGCGIPQDDLQNIFEPFFSINDPMSGTGLGLYVTFGIVKEMGGKIFVESIPTEGTTFTVVLPVPGKEDRDQNTEKKGNAEQQNKGR